MHSNSCSLVCKVYVGNLGNNGNKTDLERTFGCYGLTPKCGFACVEFEDPRDAADAVCELDGTTPCGCSVNGTVQWRIRRRNRSLPPSRDCSPQDDYCRRSPPTQHSSPRRSFSRSQSISGEEKGLCLMREISSRLDPSLGLVANEVK